MNVSIRRTGACGDVIQAMPIVAAVSNMGHSVEFQCSPTLHSVIERFGITPFIPAGTPIVDLDNSYEQCRYSMNLVSMRLIYASFAARMLAAIGIALKELPSEFPKLRMHRKSECESRLNRYPRPWVMICPRSGFHLTKTVPDNVWESACGAIRGTSFWLGIHGPAPNGIVDLEVKTFDALMNWLDWSDLFITTDTGPMHIAGAMGIRMIAIHQAFDPRLMFDQAKNMRVLAPELDCLSCLNLVCPINAKFPPCNEVNPARIADAVNEML